MKEIKSCPFCGDRGIHWHDYNNYPPTHLVACDNEECGGKVEGHATKEEAIAAWSKRV